MSFSDLPKFVLIHLCSYLDIKSNAIISLTNKKFYNTFSQMRELFKLIKLYSPQLLTQELPPTSQMIKKLNKQKISLLNFAFKSQTISTEMIKFLVENKSDLNLTNEHKNTALHLACQNKFISMETIKILVENKSNMNQFAIYKNTPLHYACESGVPIEIIKYLVENKCDLNLKDYFENTPLLDECYKETISLEKIKLLVENKSDLNLKDEQGNTPLHLACKNQFVSIEILKSFFENKSDLNLKDGNDQNIETIINQNFPLRESLKEKYGEKFSIEQILKFL